MYHKPDQNKKCFSTKKQMSPPSRNKKNHKIAFSYVTRGIMWKIYMQELWFLCMAHSLNVLYKCMKLPWNTSNGYQVIEQTQYGIANDQREITPKISKAELWFLCNKGGETIHVCLPALPGGRHSHYMYSRYGGQPFLGSVATHNPKTEFPAIDLNFNFAVISLWGDLET